MRARPALLNLPKDTLDAPVHQEVRRVSRVVRERLDLDEVAR
jgi:hypothetical protein